MWPTLVINSQDSKGGPRAMGYSGFSSVWTFLAGTLVGHIITAINFLAWWGVKSWSAELSLAKAVAEAVKDCIEWDLSSTTTVPPLPEVTGSVNFALLLVIGVFIQLLVLILVVGVNRYCCPCHCFGRGRKDGSGGAFDSGPLSPTPSIESLARNQLAEIRVRRHALQSSGIAGV